MPSHLTPVPHLNGAQTSLPTRPVTPTGPVQLAEFEHWVELVRAGADLDAVIEKGGRSRPTVTKYLRQMLPLEERGCPDPLLPERLRNLVTQGAHDWKRAMLLTPPAAPIQRIERKGVPGLTNADLVTLVLALADRSGSRDRDLFEEIRAEVRQRCLGDDVHAARCRELARGGLDLEQAARSASVWVADHLALEVGYGHSGPYGRDPWPVPYDEYDVR